MGLGTAMASEQVDVDGMAVFSFKQGTALKAFVYFTTCLARVSLTLWHKALAVVSKGSPLKPERQH